MNLSKNRLLSTSEQSVLEKGLSFIPVHFNTTGQTWDRLEMEAGLTEYHRRIKLASFFEEQEPPQRIPFIPKSDWEPQNFQVEGEVHELIKKDRNTIKGIRNITELTNLSEEEHSALKRLRNDNSIVIKPADKGSLVVIMDRAQYIREDSRQLEDKNFYRELDQPIYLFSLNK